MASDTADEQIFGQLVRPGSTMHELDLTSRGGVSLTPIEPGLYSGTDIWSEWMAEVAGDGRR